MKWLAALVLAVACGSAYAQSDNPFAPDYDPRNASAYVGREDKFDAHEGDLKLPPYPQPDALVEYEVLPSHGFRYFVDPGSIHAATGSVVRYTLLVRSRTGTENISYDGMRCNTNEHRVYATGRRTDKTWVLVRDGPWTVLKLGGLGRQHLVLMRDFFCPSGIAIDSGAEGADALRRGGHPRASGNQGQFSPN